LYTYEVALQVVYSAPPRSVAAHKKLSTHDTKGHELGQYIQR